MSTARFCIMALENYFLLLNIMKLDGTWLTCTKDTSKKTLQVSALSEMYKPFCKHFQVFSACNFSCGTIFFLEERKWGLRGECLCKWIVPFSSQRASLFSNIVDTTHMFACIGAKFWSKWLKKRKIVTTWISQWDYDISYLSFGYVGRTSCIQYG